MASVSSIQVWLQDLVEQYSLANSELSQSIDLILITLSFIWRARNQYIFEGTSPDPSSTISQATTSWRCSNEAYRNKNDLLLDRQGRFMKPHWPVCQISNLQGPTVFLLVRKIRKVSTLYFLFFVQDRCRSLGKQSNSQNLDPQLFTLTIIRNILMKQSQLCNGQVTFASNKPGTVQQMINPLTARSLLRPVISDVRSYLRYGFVIARHHMQHKDFYDIFMTLAPSAAVKLGLDSSIIL